MIEKLIHFFIHYNERILWAAAAAVCLLVAWTIYRDIFGKKTSYEAGDTQEIEDMLKRLLSQTNAAIARTEVLGDAAAPGSNGGAAMTAAGAAATGGASTEELSKIKKQLEEKVKLIEDLQSEVNKAKASSAPTDLLAKIKTLESKLSEYEIIEDDIADLSHYKDENARLKKELDALKQGGPALVDAFAAAVAEGGKTEASAEVAAAVQVTQATLAQVQAEPDLADLMGIDETQEPPKVMPQAVAAQTPPPAAPVANLDEAVAQIQSNINLKDAKATESATEAGDIFGEFSDGQPASDPLSELGDIDTSRMLEELQGLSSEMDASALEETPDVEKMAQEAVNLKKG